jgi:hypothetical protein
MSPREAQVVTSADHALDRSIGTHLTAIDATGDDAPGRAEEDPERR